MDDRTVHFASIRMKDISADASLPPKFLRMLDGYPLEEMFGQKRVAIKMHVGGNVGFTTVHPLFVRLLVQKVREAGGDPFITDTSYSMPNITARGYTQEVIGAPFIPASGVADRYVRPVRIGYRSLETANLTGNLLDADALIDLSHFKGHGHAIFGGAIKNLGMGAVDRPTRGAIHALISQELKWNADACVECRQCVEGCPTGAASFDDDGRFRIDFHNCIYCHHCVMACPEHAISFDDQNIYYFHCGLAAVTRAVLDHFDPESVLFINVLLNVTSFCDCWGFTTPTIVPDIGILASREILPVEKASLDMIRAEDFIPGTLPGHIARHGEGHLFQQIWGKDPYLQIKAGAEMGLGEADYRLCEVE